jgi:prephenate dehydrogenase
LQAARKLGIIDEIAADATVVKDADMVLLAVPPGQMAAALKQIAPHLGAHTIVTDVGSTKQDVVATARRVLKKNFVNFVPAHPIAGTENSGAHAAFAELFEGRTLIITPQPHTQAAAVRRVTAAWKLCGMQVVRMSPPEHDRIFALVSHLPHFISFALVGQIAGYKDAAALFSHSGGGFRDVSRIAASSPEMWRDIALANRPALLSALKQYQKEIAVLQDLIKRGKKTKLAARLAKASTARRQWLPSK